MSAALLTEILDTTLREGEQCYGVFFPVEVKKRIAILLDEIGVDFIEAGHPAAAPSIRRAVSEIANLNLRPRLIGHARLDKDEISLVRELGLQWVGLFCGINEKSRNKYSLSKQAIFKRVAAAVDHARELGLSVKFTCEDASRTEFGELIEFYEHLVTLGVDRLSYADTVGIIRPEDIERIYSAINGRMPFNSLHFHFHNDFGFAQESAIKAIQCGARCVDASILGIGERTGIASLEGVLAFLSGKNNKERQIEALQEAAGLVANCINQEHYRNRTFAHKSGIHINGAIKDPANYEPIEPEKKGENRIFVLSKLIGRSGLKKILFHHGFHHEEKDLAGLLQEIKSEDMLELAGPDEICGYLMEKGIVKQCL